MRDNKDYRGWQQNAIYVNMIGKAEEVAKMIMDIFKPNVKIAVFWHW